MDPRTPQCLVGIDVPDAREHALVEEERLDRRPPAGKLLTELPCREFGPERFAAEARREVILELARFEQEPGAEPADVAVGNVRSVV